MTVRELSLFERIVAIIAKEMLFVVEVSSAIEL